MEQSEIRTDLVEAKAICDRVEVADHIVLDFLEVTVLICFVTWTRQVGDYLTREVVAKVRRRLHPGDHRSTSVCANEITIPSR